jgi:hypothetical protein
MASSKISFEMHAALETKGWILFHVTFYEILQSQGENQLSELWPCGELHSDQYRQGRPRKIRESTLTVGTPSLFSSRMLKGIPDHCNAEHGASGSKLEIYLLDDSLHAPSQLSSSTLFREPR